MKLSRTHLLVVSLMSVLLIGCATPGTQVDPKVVVQDACAISHDATPAILRSAVAWAEKNPTNEVALLQKVVAVSTTLNQLLVQKNCDPDFVSAAFHVNEPYIDLLFASITTTYRLEYNTLVASGNGQMAIGILTCLTADASRAADMARARLKLLHVK